MFRVFDGRLGQQSFESSSCCLRKKVDAAQEEGKPMLFVLESDVDKGDTTLLQLRP